LAAEPKRWISVTAGSRPEPRRQRMRLYYNPVIRTRSG